jgi:hypothetical protein
MASYFGPSSLRAIGAAAGLRSRAAGSTGRRAGCPPSRHEIGHVLDLIRGLKRQKTATILISHR